MNDNNNKITDAEFEEIDDEKSMNDAIREKIFASIHLDVNKKNRETSKINAEASKIDEKTSETNLKTSQKNLATSDRNLKASATDLEASIREAKALEKDSRKNLLDEATSFFRDNIFLTDREWMMIKSDAWYAELDTDDRKLVDELARKCIATNDMRKNNIEAEEKNHEESLREATRIREQKDRYFNDIKDILEEAEELLDQGDYQEAVTKAKEVEKILKYDNEIRTKMKKLIESMTNTTLKWIKLKKKAIFLGGDNYDRISVELDKQAKTILKIANMKEQERIRRENAELIAKHLNSRPQVIRHAGRAGGRSITHFFTNDKKIPYTLNVVQRGLKFEVNGADKDCFLVKQVNQGKKIMKEQYLLVDTDGNDVIEDFFTQYQIGTVAGKTQIRYQINPDDPRITFPRP